METTLHVEGMSCQNCVRHVQQTLQAVAGVQSVSVKLETGEAIVNWKGGPVQELLSRLNEAGYPSRVLKAG